MSKKFPNTPLDKYMPNCAKCNKPVDGMRSHDDISRNVQIFTVYCHGEEETTELTHLFLAEIGPDGLKKGVAFHDRETKNITKQS